MIDFKGKYHDELGMFSSVPIQNEVLTITSEHISTESDGNFEKQLHTRKEDLNESIADQRATTYAIFGKNQELIIIITHLKLNGYSYFLNFIF